MGVNTIKKIIFGLIMCAVLFAMLSGCAFPSSSNPATGEPTSTHDDQKISSELDAAQLAIQELVYTDSYYDDVDGQQKLLEVSIRVPQFVADHSYESLNQINDYFKQLLEAKKKYAFEELLPNAKSTYQESKANSFDFMRHSFDFQSSIIYQKNNLLSVIHKEFEQLSNMAHPNSKISGNNFDVHSGKLLELKHILNGTNDQLNEKIRQLIIAEIKKTEGTPDFFYYLEYEENVKEYFDSQQFILGLESIQFLFNASEIAPYAAGLQMFDLPYSNKESFISQIEVASPSPTHEEIITEVDQLLKNNTEVVYHMYGLSMLPLNIPKEGPGNETIFPVVDNYFISYPVFESFIRSTYSRDYAEKLLTNGRYMNKDNQLYADMSKDASMGYYVDHRNYRYQITDVTENNAKLMIYTTENAPNESGTNVAVDITLSANLIKEDGNWLLEKMVMK